jgi:hypothetical protein
MSSETYLSPEQKLSHVEVIVQENPEVAGLQAYEYFRSTASDQKPAFISGELVNLDLTYPDLTVETITRVKDPMLDALKTLMPGETNRKSESLYTAVEYRYSELFMMDMARRMDDTTLDPEERAEAQQWFVRASESLYGKPDKSVFSGLAAHAIAEKTLGNDSDSVETSQIRDELSGLIGEIDESNFAPFVPSPELVTRIGNLVHERFDSLVEHIDPDQEYDVYGMVQALDTALEKLDGKKLGWRVAKVPNSSVLAVSAHQKLVEVGENRPTIKGSVLRGKTLHELGVHAGRSINAEKASWLSAEYGQEGYLDFEESFATALEDAYHGKSEEHGEDYQLVAGLGYGLDNHSPRDFRETFEVMWRTKALDKVKDGQISEKDLDKAKSSAFTSCLRLFRGTTGQQKGVIYLKDMAYSNGQESVWTVLKDVNTQQDLDLLFAGKLDNSKEEHQEIARDIVSSNAH